MSTDHHILVAILILLQLNRAQACPEDCICDPGSIRWDCSNAHLSSIYLDSDIVDLNLANNDITVLANEFFTGELRIEVLYLNDNGMQKIAPAAFSGLEELQNLYLQNNKLQSLHASIFNNNLKLKTLDLSGNLFTEFTPGLFQENHLTHFVNFTGNNLCFPSLSSDIFNDSLNVMRIEFCEEPRPYARFLQNSTSLLEELGHQRKLLLQQVKSGEKPTEILADNLNVTVNSRDFSINSEVVKNETSLLCFCDQLLMWFWCNTNEFNCVKPMNTIEMYSFLGCGLNLENMYTWSTNITAGRSTNNYDLTSELYNETNSITSANNPELEYFISTVASIPSETEDNSDDVTLPTTTDHNTSNSTSASENFLDGINLIIVIGSAVVVLVIIIVVVVVTICFVVRRRRRRLGGPIIASEFSRVPIEDNEMSELEYPNFSNRGRIG
ncbi:hypothetical protein C0J52_22241 [Blattella germanica]|nr:hypothetical protein C0J52_22241 [Blattella germanica]